MKKIKYLNSDIHETLLIIWFLNSIEREGKLTLMKGYMWKIYESFHPHNLWNGERPINHKTRLCTTHIDKWYTDRSFKIWGIVDSSQGLRMKSFKVIVTLRLRSSSFCKWQKCYVHNSHGSVKKPKASPSSNNLLTHSWNWALHEKPPFVHLLKNFPVFCETRRFITVFTRALH
jgi:hypothetical protein